MPVRQNGAPTYMTSQVKVISQQQYYLETCFKPVLFQAVKRSTMNNWRTRPTTAATTTTESNNSSSSSCKPLVIQLSSQLHRPLWRKRPMNVTYR